MARLLVDSNCEALGLHLVANQPTQDELQTKQNKEHIMDKYSNSSWYANIVYVLLHLQCPSHLNKKESRSLKLKATKYCLVNKKWHWKDQRGLLLKCLEKSEIELVISESHEGACGGHRYWKATASKILRSGYYWPSLFSYVYKKIRDCILCQKFVGKQKLQSLPLKPIAVNATFQQWGLDFIG